MKSHIIFYGFYVCSGYYFVHCFKELWLTHYHTIHIMHTKLHQIGSPVYTRSKRGQLSDSHLVVVGVRVAECL